MISKFTKSLVPLTAIVTSALLGYGLPITANAAQVTSTPANTGPVTINMRQLVQHGPEPAAIAALKNGDQVIISDDGSVTGASWQGTYIYHPAGSIVPVTAMYARWKDDLVTLTPTPGTATTPAPGTLDASWVATDVFSGTILDRHQTVATLIPEPTDPSILRIPNYAWLFRVNSNGQYVALVDTFQYVSGSQPLFPENAAGQVIGPVCDAMGCRAVTADEANQFVALGSQPVPVWSSYWQPQ